MYAFVTMLAVPKVKGFWVLLNGGHRIDNQPRLQRHEGRDNSSFFRSHELLEEIVYFESPMAKPTMAPILHLDQRKLAAPITSNQASHTANQT